MQKFFLEVLKNLAIGAWTTTACLLQAFLVLIVMRGLHIFITAEGMGDFALAILFVLGAGSGVPAVMASLELLVKEIRSL